MDSIGVVKSLVSWGMNAEYAKIQASASNISNINKPGASFRATDFSKALGEINYALRSGDVQNLNRATEKPVAMTGMPEAQVSLDKEIEKLVSSQMKFEVLAELYQRRLGLKNLVMSGGG